LPFELFFFDKETLDQGPAIVLLII
jgi:hypothetical protein